MTTELKKLPLTKKQERWRAKYGPWAVVTGASDGIGREIALCLAKAGLDLVLVARRRALLEQISTNLTQTYGTRVRIIEADLSQSEAVERVNALTNELEVGLLVACAGFGNSGRLIDSNLGREVAMLEVNCRAVLAMSHHFGKQFAKQGRGGMILMSSLLAFQGVPLSTNYAATKAYIQSLAEGLHVELAPLGVDVIASAPGPTHSGFAAQARMQMGLAAKPADVAQATLDALGRKTTVRPGFLAKFLESSLAFLPRWSRVLIMGRIMKSMTKTT
jgi:uncharacterized protein